jgi:hypothetical protein
MAATPTHDRRHPMRLLRVLALLVVCALLAVAPAAAHPAPFSYLDVRISPETVSGTLVLHDFDAAHELGIATPDALLDAEVLARQSGRMEALIRARVTIAADGRKLDWQFTGWRPLVERSAVEVSWRAPLAAPVGHLTLTAVLFPYDPNHQTFVNAYERGVLVRQDILGAQRPAADYYTGGRQGAIAVFKAFTAAGIHHIAIGPDHILFIVGLLLLGGSIPRLLGIVSAFTLGHSITLSLAALNIVTPPPRSPSASCTSGPTTCSSRAAARAMSAPGSRCSLDSCTASDLRACCAKSDFPHAPSLSRCSRSISAWRSVRPFW